MSLVELLSLFRWSRYEAFAFSTLVNNGPMRAKELAIKANIPLSRIYDVTSALRKKGWVRVHGGKVKIFVAQHPKYVLEQELNNLREHIDVAVKELEEKWELREENVFPGEDKAWVVEGTNGVLIEIRQLLRKAKRCVRIENGCTEWLTPKDMNTIKELALKNGVKVRVVDTNNVILKKIATVGAHVKIAPAVEQNRYIIDDKYALLIVGSNPVVGIVINDKETVKSMAEKYDILFKKSDDIEVSKIAR